MELSQLNTRLDDTLETMYYQTGLLAGGPTGKCGLVVIGALTGKPPDFSVPGIPSYARVEEEAGLVRYRVNAVAGMSPIQVLSDILDGPTNIPVDAVIASGNLWDCGERHMVAVVPDAKTGLYTVVDSLQPDARIEDLTLGEVQGYFIGDFNPGTIDLSVMPDKGQLPGIGDTPFPLVPGISLSPMAG